MPLQNLPQITKRHIFKEIYGRPQKPNEVFSLRQLVEDSCLPPNLKQPPHYLQKFLGYDHSLCDFSVNYSWVDTFMCSFVTTSSPTWEGVPFCLPRTEPYPTFEIYEWLTNTSDVACEIIRSYEWVSGADVCEFLPKHFEWVQTATVCDIEAPHNFQWDESCEVCKI
jgi:hypothetical protein